MQYPKLPITLKPSLVVMGPACKSILMAGESRTVFELSVPGLRVLRTWLLPDEPDGLVVFADRRVVSISGVLYSLDSRGPKQYGAVPPEVSPSPGSSNPIATHVISAVPIAVCGGKFLWKYKTFETPDGSDAFYSLAYPTGSGSTILDIRGRWLGDDIVALDGQAAVLAGVDGTSMLVGARGISRLPGQVHCIVSRPGRVNSLICETGNLTADEKLTPDARDESAFSSAYGRRFFDGGSFVIGPDGGILLKSSDGLTPASGHRFCRLDGTTEYFVDEAMQQAGSVNTASGLEERLEAGGPPLYYDGENLVRIGASGVELTHKGALIHMLVDDPMQACGAGNAIYVCGYNVGVIDARDGSLDDLGPAKYFGGCDRYTVFLPRQGDLHRLIFADNSEPGRTIVVPMPDVGIDAQMCLLPSGFWVVEVADTFTGFLMEPDFAAGTVSVTPVASVSIPVGAGTYMGFSNRQRGAVRLFTPGGEICNVPPMFGESGGFLSGLSGALMVVEGSLYIRCGMNMVIVAGK